MGFNGLCDVRLYFKYYISKTGKNSEFHFVHLLASPQIRSLSLVFTTSSSILSVISPFVEIYICIILTFPPFTKIFHHYKYLQNVCLVRFYILHFFISKVETCPNFLQDRFSTSTCSRFLCNLWKIEIFLSRSIWFLRIYHGAGVDTICISSDNWYTILATCRWRRFRWCNQQCTLLSDLHNWYYKGTYYLDYFDARKFSWRYYGWQLDS